MDKKIEFTNQELLIIVNSLAVKGNELNDELDTIGRVLKTDKKFDNNYLDYALKTIERGIATALTYLKALENLPKTKATKEAIKATKHNIRICEESYSTVTEFTTESASCVVNN